MARQVFRVVRATAAQLAPYVGPQGEAVLNTDSGALHLQDGLTPGGIPVQPIKPYAVADANYVVAVGVTFVAITALTAARTITLPPASSFTRSMALYIADETELCSPALPITIAAAGSDRIAGNGPSLTLASPGQKIVLHSNGANLWTV